MTTSKEPEYFGLTQSEWLAVGKVTVTAATTAVATIKATKKTKK